MYWSRVISVQITVTRSARPQLFTRSLACLHVIWWVHLHTSIADGLYRDNTNDHRGESWTQSQPLQPQTSILWMNRLHFTYGGDLSPWHIWWSFELHSIGNHLPYNYEFSYLQYTHHSLKELITTHHASLTHSMGTMLSKPNILTTILNDWKMKNQVIPWHADCYN